jgi:hypothetical protein
MAFPGCHIGPKGPTSPSIEGRRGLALQIEFAGPVLHFGASHYSCADRSGSAPVSSSGGRPDQGRAIAATAAARATPDFLQTAECLLANWGTGAEWTRTEAIGGSGAPVPLFGRRNGFVAEVVRLPLLGKPAARILTNSATALLVPFRVSCRPVPAPPCLAGCGSPLDRASDFL